MQTPISTIEANGVKINITELGEWIFMNWDGKYTSGSSCSRGTRVSLKKPWGYKLTIDNHFFEPTKEMVWADSYNIRAQELGYIIGIFQTNSHDYIREASKQTVINRVIQQYNTYYPPPTIKEWTTEMDRLSKPETKFYLEIDGSECNVIIHNEVNQLIQELEYIESVAVDNCVDFLWV